MKKLLFIVIVTASSLVVTQRGTAAETAQKPGKPDVKAELEELVGKVQAKLKDGKRTEAELASELKSFDELIAKHKSEKTDEVAQIVFMKAMLYLQVFENTEKGTEMLKQIKRDFPDTKPGQNVDNMLASLQQQEEAKKVQSALVKGSKFPEFAEKDTTGKPLSIASFKGKVLLIDFWATWCGPCVAELPNVLAAYEKHHKKGFEIIGISLDQDEAALKNFTKTKKMAWQQFFDGKGWENTLAVKYGIKSIPATYLIDGEGKIIGKDLRGDDLSKAVAEALAKK